MYRRKETYAMKANICNAYANATYKFMSLLPLLVCFKNNKNLIDDPFPFIIMFHTHIFVNYFSPFVIKDHKR
jgi:hypothetical protein